LAITKTTQPELEHFRASVPAARALPLLTSIAKREKATVITNNLGDNSLQTLVTPC
jgi:hypothetical protein